MSRTFCRRITTQSRRIVPRIPALMDSESCYQSPWIKAEFWRGGTSNGIVMSARDIPGWQILKNEHQKSSKGEYSAATISEMLKEAEKSLQPVFNAMMGSPDPKYGRQLNGMGGGLSSLSKAVIVDIASRPIDQSYDSRDYVDLDYCFVQIGIKDGKLDMSSNCGNMSSAVAPFAINHKMLSMPRHWHSNSQDADQKLRKDTQNDSERMEPITIRLRNLNTMKRIDAHIFCSPAPSTKTRLRFHEQGSYMMDGVPGYGSPITLSFLRPGGAKTGKALPTGNPIEEWETTAGEKVAASLLDISNPGVFIDGRTVGWDPSLTSEQLNTNIELMAKLEAIRQEGAKRMGLDPDTPSIPKIVMLFPPATEDVDITCQAISMGQAHKATPVTLALNLAVACKIPGTIAHELTRSRDLSNTIIGHPSGKLEVGAEISPSGEIVSAKLIRTARCLMYGYVNTQPSDELMPLE